MIPTIVLLIAGFLVSLSIHEAAHAYVSDLMGDPTARLRGRVTMNPLAHLDPVGTLLPLFLIISNSPIIFGWGKPVPFDPFNLKNPRRDSAVISFSGPAANLVFAVILAITLRIFYLLYLPVAVSLQPVLTTIIALNVMWAIFNLIPVHPLDGGKVIVGILPRETAHKVDELLNRYGFVIILFLLLPLIGGRSPLMLIASPLIRTILALLLPGTPLV